MDIITADDSGEGKGTSVPLDHKEKEILADFLRSQTLIEWHPGRSDLGRNVYDQGANGLSSKWRLRGWP
ncbi:hypothetical protein CEXT_195641 [Caerostris extrusa]|uniref:Uncharacterized protein n=1 Tax=Caerostris extrusa TaxID=172846 RepID=A0AAV4P6X8_CAEEX|nr:hypothetical protein CEXT_195641 [Caerostris extrusa]